MSVQDDTTGTAAGALHELDEQERALLATFIDGRPVSLSVHSRKVPFSFATGVALGSLLATTGTVIALRPDAAEEVRWSGDSTSAKTLVGPAGMRAVPAPATATRPAARVAAAAVVEAAAAGQKSVSRTPAEDVARLYELSGLTYKQISKIFGVSERTVHLWAAGQTKPSTRHVERIRKVLATVEGLAASDASTRRALLLSGTSAEPSIYNTWLRELSTARPAVGDVDTLHDAARHL